MFALDDAISLVPAVKPKPPVRKKPAPAAAAGKDKQQAAGQQQGSGSKASKAAAAEQQQQGRWQGSKDAAAASDSDRAPLHEQISTSLLETATSSGRDGKGKAGIKQEQEEAGCLSDTSEAAAKKLKRLKAEARWGPLAAHCVSLVWPGVLCV